MRIFICVALLFAVPCVHAQKADRRLQAQIDTLVRGFHGDLGVYVYDPIRNTCASIKADTLFPTASIIKITILLGIMDKVGTGALDYHQRMTYTDSLYLKEGDDILSNFKPGSTIELSKLLMLMLTISDNCASIWLQGLAGGGVRINQLLDSLGLVQTRVNSRTPGREKDWDTFGWGETTPREIVRLMDRIVRQEVFSKALSDRMLRLLGRQYWDEEALSEIPAGVFAADKNGALDGNRNEVVYVHGPHPYLFSIFTKDNADTRWTPDNEAWVLTRKLSALLWVYYDER